MKVISVILPVYNVERYITKCLESIIAQQYHDYELIIIDDCGTDRSLEICKEKLSKTNLEYRIIQNPSNSGLSTSRNIGLDNSTGQFILFIDSDDWIHPLMLTLLHEAITESGADIASCRATRFWEDSGTYSDINNLKAGTFSSDEYLNSYFKGEVNSEAWGRLFRRAIFDSVEFPNKVNNEDLLTLPFLIRRSKKIVQIEDSLYYYVQRASKTSITDLRPTNIHGFLGHLHKFKSFDTKSQTTKWNSKLFAYRNVLAIATACIFHSDNYKETQNDMLALKNFVEMSDIVRLPKASNFSFTIMALTLKCSPNIFYKLQKAVWRLKNVRK